MATPGLVEIYLMFDNNCEQAFEFYENLLGGEITSIMRYSDMPPEDEGGAEDFPDGFDDGVMHASLKLGDRTIMGSDNPYGDTTFGDSVLINWSHPDPDEVRRVWHGFIEAGAEVVMPLEASFFASLFGMITDQFGVNWQIMHWDPNSEENMS